MLGCVRIRDRRGLAGHSDGDVIAHAVADAMLGAAGLDDIGAMFPPGDPRYAGIAGQALLAQVRERLSRDGWALVNVDVTVIAEEPRLGPYRRQMQAALAESLGVSPNAVAVKAKTNEGLDATGRGEAIAAYAVALIERKET